MRRPLSAWLPGSPSPAVDTGKRPKLAGGTEFTPGRRKERGMALLHDTGRNFHGCDVFLRKGFEW